MADSCRQLSEETESSLGATILVTKMLQNETETVDQSFAIRLASASASERNAGAGDGLQTEPRKCEEDVPKICEQDFSEADKIPLQGKRASTLSMAELEQRMNLRLQKLAEFENMQQNHEQANADEGGNKKEPQTWPEFWQDVEK